MNYIVHKEVQKMVKNPKKKPVFDVEEVTMDETYDGKKADIHLQMRKNNKEADLSFTLNNNEVIQLLQNRPSIDEMLHSRLTNDFSSILNNRLDASTAISKNLKNRINTQHFPVIEMTKDGSKRKTTKRNKTSRVKTNRPSSSRVKTNKQKSMKKSMKKSKKTIKTLKKR